MEKSDVCEEENAEEEKQVEEEVEPTQVKKLLYVNCVGLII